MLKLEAMIALSGVRWPKPNLVSLLTVQPSQLRRDTQPHQRRMPRAVAVPATSMWTTPMMVFT